MEVPRGPRKREPALLEDELRYQRERGRCPSKADHSNPQGLLINYSPTSHGCNIIGPIVLMGKLRLRHVK